MIELRNATIEIEKIVLGESILPRVAVRQKFYRHCLKNPQAFLIQQYKARVLNSFALKSAWPA